MNTLLLAKSAGRGSAARTLFEHTDDVLNAFDALFGGDENSLTSAWLRFFRLDAGVAESFRQLGRLAALCHDWGKANDGSQLMLARRGRQSVRHEYLSAVILMRPAVWQWIGGGGPEDVVWLRDCRRS